MKLYLRLFIANPVSLYGCILFVVSIFLLIDPYYLIHHPPVFRFPIHTNVWEEYLVTAAGIALFLSFFALFMTDFGKHPVKLYFRFKKIYLLGHKNIIDHCAKNIWPCTRTAARLVKKDFGSM